MHSRHCAQPVLVLALAALVGFGYGQANLPETMRPAIDEAPLKAHSYDWMARHNAVLDRLKQGKVDLILVGDSITQMWGGSPQPGGPGQFLWDKYFGSRNAVNLGFGWDRTQHVLWRLQNGEIDGIRPKVAVVLIGTNNIGTNTTDDVVAGIDAIVDTLHTKLRRTKILLLGIFPRGHGPETRDRKLIEEVNTRISALGKKRGIVYLDLSANFLEPDGTITTDMMRDYLHPTPKGLAIWVHAMEPTLAKMFGDKPRDPAGDDPPSRRQ